MQFNHLPKRSIRKQEINMEQEITGFEVTIENGHEVVYFAYQGDISEFQTVYVTEEPIKENKELTEAHILGAMRACLAGWWAASENKIVADMARHKGKYIVQTHGFVVRITEQGWRAYDVEYTSESLSEAVVTQLPCEGLEPPIPLPLFVFKAFKTAS